MRLLTVPNLGFPSVPHFPFLCLASIIHFWYLELQPVNKSQSLLTSQFAVIYKGHTVYDLNQEEWRGVNVKPSILLSKECGCGVHMGPGNGNIPLPLKSSSPATLDIVFRCSFLFIFPFTLCVFVCEGGLVHGSAVLVMDRRGRQISWDWSQGWEAWCGCGDWTQVFSRPCAARPSCPSPDSKLSLITIPEICYRATRTQEYTIFVEFDQVIKLSRVKESKLFRSHRG